MALKLVISSGYAVQRALVYTKTNNSCGDRWVDYFITLNAAGISSVIIDIQVYTFLTSKYYQIQIGTLSKDIVDAFSLVLRALHLHW